MLAGTLFTPSAGGKSGRQIISGLAAWGAGLLAAGFLLRPLHGFSKIRGTESYGLATAGLCCLALLLFYWVLDVLGSRRWAIFLRPIGRNPLLAYILPDIVGIVLGLVSGLVGVNLWRTIWPAWEKGGGAGILSAAAMTAVILGLTWVLTRLKIVLKI
jgi:predicted acyltransferase